MDRVTIREREEIENEEERLEKEKQRQAELRKRESRRVCEWDVCIYNYTKLASYPGSWRGGERERGIHCLCKRLITMTFHCFRISSFTPSYSWRHYSWAGLVCYTEAKYVSPNITHPWTHQLPTCHIKKKGKAGCLPALVNPCATICWQARLSGDRCLVIVVWWSLSSFREQD